MARHTYSKFSRQRLPFRKVIESVQQGDREYHLKLNCGHMVVSSFDAGKKRCDACGHTKRERGEPL
jgi:ribosomal protein L37E